jgi:UDP-GlcNAc:undecaprenyl-phosphate GlcNAc-1-phosphate transferase
MTFEFAIFWVLTSAVAAAFLSWILAFSTRRWAWKYGALSYPGGRRIHETAMPQWGGLGILLAALPLVGLAQAFGFLENVKLQPLQITGFLVGLLILLAGGLIDDCTPLKPGVQILFPIAAALVVMLTGTSISLISSPLGNHPLSLNWWSGGIGPFAISFPADILTFVWLMLATYTTKILDGLDGLVDGLAVIGAGLVGALSLSTAYFQPAVAILSGIVGGSFLGFLPHNRHPAKQYLGEAGALMAGFSLGVLAILSSAKIAIALAVLAIPITDLVLVVMGRIRRGAPWYKGDNTHLHFRLMKAGVPHRLAVLVYWGVALFAGVLALGLQTRGKIFLVVTLVVVAALASYVAGTRADKAGAQGNASGAKNR